MSTNKWGPIAWAVIVLSICGAVTLGHIADVQGQTDRYRACIAAQHSVDECGK